MFQKLLKRKDVHDFFVELLVPDTRFSKKEIPHMICEEKISIGEYNLLVGLDAIFKYAVIINDEQYFEEFLDQLRKILKKVPAHKDIQTGISRIIIHACMQKFGFKIVSDYSTKNRIVSYIYSQYIVSGYLFHSFPSRYLDTTEENGIVNKACNFDEMKEIIKRYDDRFDISSDIAVTDSPFMAFFYAYHSPYFMNKITDTENGNDAFFEKNYTNSIKNLVYFCKEMALLPVDRNKMVMYFNKAWNEYDLDDNFPTVSVVRRSSYGRNALRDYPQLCAKLKEDEEITAIVSSILEPRFNRDTFEHHIPASAIQIYKLPSLDNLGLKRVKMGKKDLDQVPNFADEYGNVTIIALVGVLFITLGITITIIMLGGLGVS